MRFVHVRRSTGIKTSGGGGGKGKRLAIYPVAHTARALACFRISGGRAYYRERSCALYIIQPSFPRLQITAQESGGAHASHRSNARLLFLNLKQRFPVAPVVETRRHPFKVVRTRVQEYSVTGSASFIRFLVWNEVTWGQLCVRNTRRLLSSVGQRHIVASK